MHMANELARTSPPPATPSEDDYRALCEALSESGRGRAFLAEHARRSRDADIQALLAAITRLEARLRADASAVQRLRDDLRMLLIAIRLARPQIDTAGPAAQAVQLAQLLDLLERRIDALADARPAELTPPDDEAADARASLATVPSPDEPELPIPSPARFEPRPLALVPAAAQPEPVAAQAQAPTEKVESAAPREVAFLETAPPAVVATSVAAPPAIVETAISETAIVETAIVETAIVEIPAAEIAVAEPAAQPVLPPADPLAALMALSEDERLALFT
jgi:hypothetical protein